MYNGSFPCWYCFGEAVTPYAVSDPTIQNWLIISLSVSYWLLAVSWFTSFILSTNNRASGIHVIIGMVALFSGFGAVSDILGTYMDGFPFKFFFQSVSGALLLICLLLTSTGSGITRSGQTLNSNQWLAIATVMVYFAFQIIVISLIQLGYSVSITRMVGYPIFFIVFAAWIAVNWVQVKSQVTGDQPRQLFFRHFMEVLIIFVFCTLVLTLTDFVTCKTYWHSWKPNADVITASIGSGLRFLLVAFLMLMMRPSRMQLIRFTDSPSLLEKKDNPI